MKKMTFFLFAALLGLKQANAQNRDTLIISAGAAKNISLAENMNVVLVQTGAQENPFSINEKTARMLSITLSDGLLQIEPQGSLPKQTTVYVLVRELDRLSVGFKTQVRTIGILKTKGLDVFVDGQATAHLRTSGKIKAHAMGDYDISVVEQPTDLLARNTR